MADLTRRIEDAFGGRIAVDRELGGGGMSRVFLATATGVKRPVVVKVLPPELIEGESLRARLERERGLPIVAIGEVARAQALAAEWDRNVPAEYRNVDAAAIERTLGNVAQLEGRPAEAYLRLGELHEAKGDLRKSIMRYEDFVALWKNADPDRQPIVADIRARITRLRGRIG